MPTEQAWQLRRSLEESLRRLEQDLTAAATDSSRFERACLLDQLGDTDRARAAYLDVLACNGTHAGALANLGTLLLATGYTSAARTAFARAVALYPADPEAHVRLANLDRLMGRFCAARGSYETALALAPDCPQAHQGMAHILDGVDEAASERHRRLGFSNRALTTATYRGEHAPIIVLQFVSARGGNIPTASILSDRYCLVHTLVAEFADSVSNLPLHHVVFNAIGDADRCGEALVKATQMLRHAAVPIINPPDNVLPTRRLDIAQRLSRVPGIIVPRIEMLPRAALTAPQPPLPMLPFLLRSPGFHTGQHFCKIDQVAELPGALAALPGEQLMTIEYIESAGPDGASRKYRVMFIGDAMFPLHLAISSHWKVHYFTSEMAGNAAHRAEEARFLADMEAMLGKTAMLALATIRETLRLDYGGIDFVIAPDGRLILFEANATMTMAPPPADTVWTYRRQAYNRALAATHALVRASANARDKAADFPHGY